MSGVKVAKVAAADVAANRRRGGDIRVLLGPATVGSTSGFLGALTLQPGEYVTEHYHPYSEEFLYVVRRRPGRAARRRAGDGCAAGDALLVPISVRHRLVNVGDEQAVLRLPPRPAGPAPGTRPRGHRGRQPGTRRRAAVGGARSA